MIEEWNAFVKSVEKEVTDFLNSKMSDEMFSKFIELYNRYVFDEGKYNLNPIYDIYKQSDLEYLVEKGFTSSDIANAVNHAVRFICHNREKNVFYSTKSDSIKMAFNYSLEDMVRTALLYVDRCKEYAWLYNIFVVDTIENNEN